MKSLLELIKSLYGSKAIASTIGSKTNVIRLPSNKLQKYISKDLNIEAASDAAAQKAFKEMEELIPEISRMNDAERLIFESNLRRLKNKIKPETIEAEVIGITTKEPISKEGIKQLVEEVGQVSPPGTMIGNIESRVNKLKQLGKEMEKTTGEKTTLGDVLKEFGTSQKSLSRIQDEGLVRATARQILINDIKAGKIKNITIEEAINIKEPIDPFRKLYGEDALEQLDSLIPELRGLKTEMDAEKLARSKFKFEPDINRLPGSVSIEEALKAEQEFGINKPKQTEVINITSKINKNRDPNELIDEYNKNKIILSQVDEEGGTKIGYEQFKQLQNRNTEIENILDSLGIKSAPEVKSEGIVIPFKKKPDEFAKGGSAGLDYLMGL
jgi:hypothetical protein